MKNKNPFSSEAPELNPSWMLADPSTHSLSYLVYPKMCPIGQGDRADIALPERHKPGSWEQAPVLRRFPLLPCCPLWFWTTVWQSKIVRKSSCIMGRLSWWREGWRRPWVQTSHTSEVTGMVRKRWVTSWLVTLENKRRERTSTLEDRIAMWFSGEKILKWALTAREVNRNGSFMCL